MSVRAFKVWHKSKPEWAEVVNAASRGKAMVEKFNLCREVGWNVRFVDFRAVVVGGPVTSDGFRRCAAYRGLPGLECGQRVRVGESLGTVVGHNASANFKVVFDEDAPKYAGMELNVHPQGMEVVS